jgi:hypothetical protein
MVAELYGFDPSAGFAVENSANRTGFVFVAKGDELDVIDLVGTFAEDHVFKHIEKVVEIKDAKLVTGFDKGDKGTSFA